MSEVKERQVFSYDPSKGFNRIEEPSTPEPNIEDVQEEVKEVNSEENTELNQQEVDISEIEHSTENVNETVVDVNNDSDNEQHENVVDVENDENVNNEEQEQIDSTNELIETDNFFIAAAERLKQLNVLPDDFSLEENLDDSEADVKIFEAYKDSKKNEIFTELFNEFQSQLESEGFTKEHLEYSKLLSSGINPSEIHQIVDYKSLKDRKIEELSKEDKEDYVRKSLKDQKLKDNYIKKLLDSSEIDDDLDTLVSEANEYFTTRYNTELQEKSKIAERNNNLKIQEAQKNQSIISKIFNESNIKGEKLDDDELDEFESALYDRKIPINNNGKIYNLTPYEEFELKFQNDLETRLLMFKKYHFRETEKLKLKAQAEKIAEENNLVKWGKKTVKSKKTINNKKETPINIPKGGKSYIYENGRMKPLN